VQHTAGSVAVTAAVLDDHVELRVVDHGPGVATADRDRLFAPFQRLGDSPAGQGVGLGLAVARGLTEAMAGMLTAEDTPGGGLTLVALLDAAAVPALPPEHQSAPAS
jgi:two-component system sensor histidine kinase KdpD